MLFVETVGVNVLAQGALRRFTQGQWMEHPTFQLRGGHSTTELIAVVKTAWVSGTHIPPRSFQCLFSFPGSHAAWNL